MNKLHKFVGSFVGLLIVMLIGNVAYGQKQTVKTNLANLAISGGSIHYERVLTDATSAQLGVFMSAVTIDDTKFSGFGIVPQYRFYPGNRNAVPHGFYLAPLLGYQTFTLETTSGQMDAKADFTLIGAGLDIGSQWLINRAFSVELSAGVSFNSTNLKVRSGDEGDFSTGGFGSTTPRVGVSLGYAF